MAFITVDGIRSYYRLEGADGLPVVVLSHSLGQDHTMWDGQMPDLLARFRVLRYDVRGHGATDAPEGDYTIEELGRDALALLDALHLERVAWCGLSLGGMVGQWLAVHVPERLSHLVLANTSPRIADPAGMEARRTTVLARGMSAVVEIAMSRFFTPALIEANPARVASARDTFLTTSPVGYASCCAALRDFDGNAALGRIGTPTLVISGDADVAMPFDNHAARLGCGSRRRGSFDCSRRICRTSRCRTRSREPSSSSSRRLRARRSTPGSTCVVRSSARRTSRALWSRQPISPARFSS